MTLPEALAALAGRTLPRYKLESKIDGCYVLVDNGVRHDFISAESQPSWVRSMLMKIVDEIEKDDQFDFQRIGKGWGFNDVEFFGTGNEPLNIVLAILAALDYMEKN